MAAAPAWGDAAGAVGPGLAIRPGALDGPPPVVGPGDADGVVDATTSPGGADGTEAGVIGTTGPAGGIAALGPGVALRPGGTIGAGVGPTATVGATWLIPGGDVPDNPGGAIGAGVGVGARVGATTGMIATGAGNALGGLTGGPAKAGGPTLAGGPTPAGGPTLAGGPMPAGGPAPGGGPADAGGAEAAGTLTANSKSPLRACAPSRIDRRQAKYAGPRLDDLDGARFGTLFPHGRAWIRFGLP